MELLKEIPEDQFNGKNLVNGIQKAWACPVCGTVNAPQNKTCVKKCISKEATLPVDGRIDGKTLLNE